MAAVFMIYCCDLYRHRSTVDCFYRVLVGVGAADRQLLHRLELRGIARLGLPDQRIYLDGQSTQTLEARPRNAPRPLRIAIGGTRVVERGRFLPVRGKS